MAFLVSSGDSDAMHAFTHGIMSRDDLSYFKDRVESASRTATGYAAKFLDRARESLENLDLGGLRRSVDRLRERFGARFDEDRICSLISIPSLRDAKPTNRRYVMAMPRLRELYMKERCSGYEGDFINDEPGFVGVLHDDYRAVMNGAFVETKEGGWVTHLSGKDDPELDHFEREMVRDTWAFIDQTLDEGVHDLTCKYGSYL